MGILQRRTPDRARQDGTGRDMDVPGSKSVKLPTQSKNSKFQEKNPRRLFSGGFFPRHGIWGNLLNVLRSNRLYGKKGERCNLTEANAGQD